MPQIAQQNRDEYPVGRDVEQRSFPCTLAYRRKGAGVVALAIEADPFDLHRQDVARGDAALSCLEEGKPGLVVADIAERDRRGQPRMDGLWRAFRIPAASSQKSRQHVAFEYAAGAGQRYPGRAHRDDESLELRNH